MEEKEDIISNLQNKILNVRLDYYVRSFITGKVVFTVGKSDLIYIPPNDDSYILALYYACEEHDNSVYDLTMSLEDSIEYLKELGLWSDEDEEQLQTLNNNLDNMKVDYFNNFYKEKTRRYILSNIKSLEEKIDQLSSKKYVLYSCTREYMQNYSFLSYLLQKNCFDVHTMEPAPATIPINNIINEFVSAKSELASVSREVAKNKVWRTLWTDMGKNLFECKLSTLLDFQLYIITWSYFYDGVYNSMETPPSEVIEDDYAIDGWSIKQQREAKQKALENQMDATLPKGVRDAENVFIPVKPGEEKRIIDLNTPEGKRKMQKFLSNPGRPIK